MTQNTPTHLYQEIAESLRRQLAAGELQPGDRLPPVRAMARQWGCTPGTVSRAYAVLADEGLVSGHRGGGTRVAQVPAADDRPFLRWALLINRAEQFLLEAVGGGHTPTQVQAALSLAISRWQAVQEKVPPPPAPSVPTTRLRFVGSHDPAIGLLAEQLAGSRPRAALDVTFVGSLGGLMALARGEADVAGTHLWDETTDTYNEPFVRRLLPGQRLALVTLAQRSLGLILPAGNPQAVHGLSDLQKPGIRWINRQPGSGTRVWLDAQLQALGVDRAAIAGYDHAVVTHMGVAEAIHAGAATAGLGIRAAAAAYALHFVPLTQETYQLVVPQPVWETAVWQALLAIIRGSQFQEAVATLGGYTTVGMGTVQWL